VKIPQPRLGTFVTIGGREYQANSDPVDGVVTIFATTPDNPDPRLFDKDTTTGHWVGDVRTADCETVMAVSTRASWKGELCAVMSITDDGEAVLYHLGNNRAKSADEGFRMLSPGTYARTVPVVELANYHEFQADLLFDEWRHTTFPAPANSAP
jgi:hypothetical protein